MARAFRDRDTIETNLSTSINLHILYVDGTVKDADGSSIAGFLTTQIHHQTIWSL